MNKINEKYFNIFFNYLYSCDRKDKFLESLLQSSMTHDPSNLILICWFIVINLNKSFVQKIQKKNIYKKYTFFITNQVFTVTFDYVVSELKY